MRLMAGYGLQLWPIQQDMSQYLRSQRRGVANFRGERLRDCQMMIGREPTGYQSHKPGDVLSVTSNVTARDLMTPDEIMQIPADIQRLRIQGHPVNPARKLRFLADREFDGLYTPQPL